MAATKGSGSNAQISCAMSTELNKDHNITPDSSTTHHIQYLSINWLTSRLFQLTFSKVGQWTVHKGLQFIWVYQNESSWAKYNTDKWHNMLMKW